MKYSWTTRELSKDIFFFKWYWYLPYVWVPVFDAGFRYRTGTFYLPHFLIKFELFRSNVTFFLLWILRTYTSYFSPILLFAKCYLVPVYFLLSFSSVSHESYGRS